MNERASRFSVRRVPIEQGPSESPGPSFLPERVQEARAQDAQQELMFNPRHKALAGIRGASGRLPYLSRLRRSFGREHLLGIKAHSGATPSEACQAMGAAAYAYGSNSVAFKGRPTLHTVAHEVAHLVQQRQGLTLKEGLGQPGDAHERQADAVADRVVRGRPAFRREPRPASLNERPAQPQLQMKMDEPEKASAIGNDNSAYAGHNYSNNAGHATTEYCLPAGQSIRTAGEKYSDDRKSSPGEADWVPTYTNKDYWFQIKKWGLVRDESAKAKSVGLHVINHHLDDKTNDDPRNIILGSSQGNKDHSNLVEFVLRDLGESQAKDTNPTSYYNAMAAAQEVKANLHGEKVSDIHGSAISDGDDLLWWSAKPNLNDPDLKDATQKWNYNDKNDEASPQSAKKSGSLGIAYTKSELRARNNDVWGGWYQYEVKPTFPGDLSGLTAYRQAAIKKQEEKKRKAVSDVDHGSRINNFKGNLVLPSFASKLDCELISYQRSFDKDRRWHKQTQDEEINAQEKK